MQQGTATVSLDLCHTHSIQAEAAYDPVEDRFFGQGPVAKIFPGLLTLEFIRSQA